MPWSIMSLKDRSPIPDSEVTKATLIFASAPAPAPKMNAIASSASAPNFMPKLRIPLSHCHRCFTRPLSCGREPAERVVRFLQRRAHDDAIGHTGDFGEILRADAAADNDRGGADSVPRHVDERQRLLIGLAGQHETICATQADCVLDILRETAARDGRAGSVVNVGEDSDVLSVASVARTDRREGLAA